MKYIDVVNITVLDTPMYSSGVFVTSGVSIVSYITATCQACLKECQLMTKIAGCTIPVATYTNSGEAMMK